jgi:alpha-N-arabinofuranosidase
MRIQDKVALATAGAPAVQAKTVSGSRPMKRLAGLSAAALLMSGLAAQAQTPDDTLSLTLRADEAGPVINRDIFGQFAEHLGEGIYGGVWVGKDSKIPNVRGIRTDVVQALRALHVPNVRWPGGCYADEYHWKTGVGPAKDRVTTVNANWGNMLEPNTFGTDEYMDFLQQIGSEAYVNVNLATGTPQEAADWLEYMTTDLPTTLGQERVANGHKAPYRVKYLGFGNESWGCGGSMSTDAYIDRLKLYSTFVRNLNPEQDSPLRYVRGPNAVQRIAVGPDAGKTEYTEALMSAWKGSAPWRWGFEGLSLHFYAMGATPFQTPATDFGEKDYAALVKESIGIEDLITKHAAIMDRYDPQKKVALVVDEWGAWLKPLPGTHPRYLKQQNSMRDGILAALNLNIFARHADRVRMANIAQMINVLQAMILTDKDKMLLTPTYYVYKMYVPFQDAQSIPLKLQAGEYTFGDTILPRVDGVAARGKDGKVWLALTNVDPNRPAVIDADVTGVSPRSAVGEVLTAERVDTVNTFEHPNAVIPKPVSVQAAGGKLRLRLPPKSVTVVRLEP